MKGTRLPPDGNLSLQWVFGYNGHSSRNNAKVNAEGNLVYYVAGVGVIHDHVNHKQLFFTGHSDDITSLAINSEGRIAATGQRGKDACIAVWNALNCDPLSVLHDAHEFIVGAIGFSYDSKFLASVGGDPQATYLVVWDWRKGRRAARNRISGKVEEVEFHPEHSFQLVTCGENNIRIWRLRGNVLDSQTGLFLKAPQEHQRSVAFLSSDVLVSGSAGGNLLVWIDGKVAKILQNIHPGGVSSLEAFRGGVITGGNDGTIKIFDINLNQTAELPNAPSLVYKNSCPIQSLSSFGDKIVVGTQQNEIWLIKWKDLQPLPAECIVQGHGMKELWGLATHPSKPIAVTGSDDKTIRLWSLKDLTPLTTTVLKEQVRALAFNPAGTFIAAGLSNGTFVILDANSLTELRRLTDRKEVRHDLKYSPDGKLLAVASNDNYVDIYSVEKNYKKLKEFSGISSFVTHVDWSLDSNFVQINSGAGERLIFQIDGKGNGIVRDLPKDVEWASWTSVLGKDVEGMWAKYSDINDINAVDANTKLEMIVSGDDFGLVKLFRYPCPKRGSKPRAFVGHSEHVTNVRWSFDSNLVISVGGADHAVFVWVFRPSQPTISSSDTVSVRNLEDDSDDDVMDTEDELEAIPEVTGDVEEELTNVKKESIKTRVRAKSCMEGRVNQRVELRDGSTFAKRREEKDEENVKNELPFHSLSVEHVFGYRSFDCRDNCHWLKDQRIAYHVAAIGIVANPETGEQKHYLHHTDDILCLTVHPDGELIATAEIGHKPSVHVWSSSTLKIMSYLGGGHERGVTALAFSGDGEMLASVGMDDYHSIVVWKWLKGQKIASVRNYTKKVFGISFSPSSNNHILTFGERHIRAWTVVGSGMAWRKIRMGDKFKMDTVLSCETITVESEGKWIVGLSSGHVLIVSQTGVERSFKAHKGAVYTIHTSPKDWNLAWTGGKDGLICEWNQQFDRCLKSYPVSDHSLNDESAVALISSQSKIKSISWNVEAKKQFLIGTHNSEILLMNSSGEISIFEQGHCKGEVWGLATHPRRLEAVSVSDDRYLRRWSLGSLKAIGAMNIRKGARCIDFHPEGLEIAIGFLDGSVSLMSYPGLERVGSAHHRRERIADVRFSPDGRLLAVASHDSFVDLYVVDSDGDIVSTESSGLKRIGVCRDASSFISHVTWHTDSRLLQINSGAGEQLFYEAPKGTRLLIPEKSEKLLAWASPLTCPLDVTVAGIWEPKNDLTDINAIATAHTQPLVASVSDEGGLLKLFKYPAMGSLKRYRCYGAHSSHVTNVRWSSDDSHLVTTGGADTSVIVWKVRRYSDSTENISNDRTLQQPDVPAEEATFKDYEISGLTDVSPLPPLIDSRRLTFKEISKEKRANSEQFLLAVQKLRSLPTMNGDSNVFYLSESDIKNLTLKDGNITTTSIIHDAHDSPVTAITISDGSPLMVASAEMSAPLIHIWHPKDGAIVTKLVVEGTSKIVTCLSFCDNGRYIAALCDASIVHIFNWVKGKAISNAELKTGGVVAIKFVHETTVAALTPKELFLCDMVGNALLPTRTLVPPGILPNPEVVLTSLTVDSKEKVFVGCSDKSVVEWSARVAVRRSNKDGVNTKQQKAASNIPISKSPPNSRFIITSGHGFIFSAYREKNDMIIQKYSADDLTFVEEYITPAPTKTWAPSAISFGSTYLIIGAMKKELFLLFNVTDNSFKLLNLENIPSPKAPSTAANKVANENSSAKAERTTTAKPDRTNTIKPEKTTAAKTDISPEKSEETEDKSEKKVARKESWFKKWL